MHPAPELEIDRIDLTHLRIPLREPFRISGGEVAVKDAILVQVRAGDLVGCGESSPMAAGFGYNDVTPESCWGELEHRIAPPFIGRRCADLDDASRLVDAGPGSRFAKAGLETALWDLFGKATGRSIASMLGGDRARVESGLAVGLYATTAELLDRIAQHLGDGYKRVKIKIKPGSDVQLVEAVRERFGALPLFVDANAAYTIDQLDTFQRLDKLGLMMIEQPFAADDCDGLERLQSEIETPVCVDESAETVDQTRELLRRGCCRIVNIKIQRVGGLRNARAIHDACRDAGAACWVGTMPELGIGQAQGIHLGALAGCSLPSDIEPSRRWFADDYTDPPIELSEPGCFAVPDAPGLGYRVSDRALARYRVRSARVRVG
jgi:O-succinylbenzoate synthase